MNNWILWFLLGFSVLLQSFVVSIPLVVGILLIIYILTRNEYIFIAALLCGFVMDIAMINNLGMSSIIMVGFLSVVHIYERKFEIRTKEFVALWTFLGSAVYLFLLSHTMVFQQALVSSIVATLLFLIMEKFKLAESTYTV